MAKTELAVPDNGMITNASITQAAAPTERILNWFKYEHLPPHLQDASKPFCELAEHIVVSIHSGPERTVALRKLLEAKDAAVRAKLNPGC